MTEWSEAPTQGDRDAAIALIRAAAERGEIVAADQELRIQAVRNATSVGEINLLTRGMAGSGTVPGPAPGTVPIPASGAVPRTGRHPSGPPPSVSPSTGVRSPRRVVRRRSVLPFVLLLFLVSGVITVVIIVAINSHVEDRLAATAPDEPGPTDIPIHNADALAGLTADVEAETGSTKAHSVLLYPTYAIVTVPPGPDGAQALRYRWNGENLDEGREVTESDRRKIDLAALDWKVLERLGRRAEKALGAQAQYFTVHPPDAAGAEIQAYVALDSGRTGFISAALDGRVVRVNRP